jgi:hypothetical protein
LVSSTTSLLLGRTDFLANQCFTEKSSKRTQLIDEQSFVARTHAQGFPQTTAFFPFLRGERGGCSLVFTLLGAHILILAAQVSN